MAGRAAEGDQGDDRSEPRRDTRSAVARPSPQRDRRRSHGHRHQHPRGRVRARAPARLDQAAARGHADRDGARPRARAPRPARGDVDHRRVERAVHAHARPAGVGDRGREHRGREALRGLRGVCRGGGRDDPEVPRPGRRRRRHGRRPGDDGAARPAVGPHLLHGEPGDRKDHSPGGREAPDPDRARAGRQEPDDRPLVGAPQGRRPPHRVSGASPTRATSAPPRTTCSSGPRSRTSSSLT